MSHSLRERELPPPQTQAELLPWLLECLQPMNRTRIKQLLRSGRVAVNATPTTRHDHPLRPGDRVTILPDDIPGGVRRKNYNDGLTIVYRDEAILVVDKPTGLLSVATDTEKLDTAFVRLKTLLAAEHQGRPFVVHRLDRETSGLLLFARSEGIRDRLQESWESVKKTYLAIVEGKLPAPEGRIENYLHEGGDLKVRASRASKEHAKRAATRYRQLATQNGLTLVEVDLETGRKHQIRVHLAGLGCPVVGDQFYGARTNPAGRLGLHAWRLSFSHPVSGALRAVEAPFPHTLSKLVPWRPTAGT
jgi:23S rRNA pseudouridine1911/1915/1917 synthase